MLQLKKNDEGYKETTVYLLSTGCLVRTNNDVELTDDIKLALAMVIKSARENKINRLAEKFGGGNGGTGKAV